MISEKLLSRIRLVEENRFQIAAKTIDGIALLRSVYKEVFKESYAEGCGPCHEQAYFKLMKLLNNPQNFIDMSKRKYLLKKGRVISIFNSPEVFTNDNLTDEKAKQLLEERPELASSFQVINGKDVTAPEEEEVTEDTKLLPAAQIIAAIKNADSIDAVNGLLGNDTRVSVLKAADARILELSGPVTKILTQEDFDKDPALAEQGLKVGDKVKVEEQD